MMLPPATFSPPNFFTPRRRPAESRPLRDEPPAFLCAISRNPYFFAAGFLAGAFLAGAALAAAGFDSFAGAAALAAGFLAGALSAFAAGAASLTGAAFLSASPSGFTSTPLAGRRR